MLILFFLVVVVVVCKCVKRRKIPRELLQQSVTPSIFLLSLPVSRSLYEKREFSCKYNPSHFHIIFSLSRILSSYFTYKFYVSMLMSPLKKLFLLHEGCALIFLCSGTMKGRILCISCKMIHRRWYHDVKKFFFCCSWLASLRRRRLSRKKNTLLPPHLSFKLCTRESSFISLFVIVIAGKV